MNGIILDVLIIGIVILGLLIGRRHGILESVTRLISILVSLLIGILLSGRISELLGKSVIYERILKHTIKVMSSRDGILLEIFPQSLKKIAELLEKQGSMAIAKGFSTLAIEIISFAVVALISWIILVLIRAAVRRARATSIVVGMMDSLLGMIVGFAIALIFVCLVLAFAFPITTMIDPEQILIIQQMLDSSYLASYIYNHNPLLLFVSSI